MVNEVKRGAGTDRSRGSGLSGARLLAATLLNALITAVEVAGGIASGSLALLSDAAHNLGDTAAIAFSYAAWRIAGRGRRHVLRNRGEQRLGLALQGREQLVFPG